MLPTLIGTELDKIETVTKDKVLIKKNKRLSQNLIMLKKTEHTLHPSHLLPPLKRIITQLTKWTNKGLPHCLVVIIKFRNKKNTKNPMNNYPQTQFRCFSLDCISIKLKICYTIANMHS